MDFEAIRSTFSTQFAASTDSAVQSLAPAVANHGRCWVDLAADFRAANLTLESKIEIWRSFIAYDELRLMLWFIGVYDNEPNTLQAMWLATDEHTALTARIALVLQDSIKEFLVTQELPLALQRFMEPNTRTAEQKRVLSSVRALVAFSPVSQENVPIPQPPTPPAI